MSLWKVNDQTTREFMTEFYGQWLKKGLGIPEAFRNAQHKMKLKYPGGGVSLGRLGACGLILECGF